MRRQSLRGKLGDDLILICQVAPQSVDGSAAVANGSSKHECRKGAVRWIVAL